MKKKILYIDMDGVVADFEGKMLEYSPGLNQRESGERSAIIDEICLNYPHVFKELDVIPDAIECLTKLFELDLYEIYFLSTPMWDVPESYKGKRLWLEKYFGEHANRKLILSHRKDLLKGDFLVDDRIKHGVDKFEGEHIHFRTDPYFMNWKMVFNYLLYMHDER